MEQNETTQQTDQPTAEAMPSPEEMLQAAELKAQEHYDAWMYAKAEGENIRRRAQDDISKAQKFAVERFSTEMLAVMDSLQAGLAVQTIRTIVQADKRVAADPPPSIAMARFNSTDKVTEIEVHVWADQSAHDILRADLLAAVWAAILKP